MDIPADLSSLSLADLQSMLRQVDLNGWLTLEEEEQNDVEVLRDALAYLRDMQ